MQVALDNKLSFWWNWDTHPKIDTDTFTPDQRAAVDSTFVPMLWGQGEPDDGYSFLSNTTQNYVMTYNEPDQYGPACVGDWNPPAYGCAPGQYRPATSDGWFPTFDPSTGTASDPHAAQFFQWSVNNMTTLHPINPNGINKIVSPSMAQGAAPGPNCIGVDPSQPGTIKVCQGWLHVFKQYALNLTCTNFSGAQMNCWDVIDSIQIHAYSHTAAAIKAKIQEYYSVFQEDFEGTNGRTKKTLWLTEVAMGSNNGTEIVSFINDLMNPTDGLTNRQQFGYVQRVSWFSEWSFGAFTTDGIVPNPLTAWASSLFYPFGSLSPLGTAYFGHCNNQ